MFGSCVVQTEEDDAHHVACRPREDLAKIEVKRQHDPLLGESLLEDVAIRKSLQTLNADVNGVVARRAQPLDHPPRNAHVAQESHQVTLLRRDHFFLGQPRRIRQRLLKIVGFEVGVVGQHFVPARSMG